MCVCVCVTERAVKSSCRRLCGVIGSYIFWLQLLVASSSDDPIQFLQILHQGFLVFEPQLLADDVQVSDRVDVALDVRHVVVFESALEENREITFVCVFVDCFFGSLRHR